MPAFATTALRALAFAIAAACCGSACAVAQRYSRVAFDRAMLTNVPVVIHVCAAWSPLCRTQKPIVGALLREPALSDIVLFNAEFDHDFELRRTLHVFQQATLVVFRDGREVARSSGDTERAAIEALLKKAVSGPAPAETRQRPAKR